MGLAKMSSGKDPNWMLTQNEKNPDKELIGLCI